MNGRKKYLASNQSGKMESEYLRLCNILNDTVITSHLDNSDFINIKKPTESADPHIRKDQRDEYIKSVTQWLKIEKKSIKTKIKAAKKLQHSQEALNEQLLSHESYSNSENTPEDFAPETTLKEIELIENVLTRMEEARQSERYLEVYEVHVMPHTRKAHLSTLNFNPHVGAYQVEAMPESKLDTITPTFKIVTGGRRLKDHDDVVIQVTQNEYNTLQELGATGNREHTLIAKLINDYGCYRRTILNSAIRFKAKTDTWMIKEKICQQIIARLRALQDIESAYGDNTAAIQTKINSYKQKIGSQKDTLENELSILACIDTFDDDSTFTKEEHRWIIITIKDQINGLNDDLAQLAKLQKINPENISEKTIAHWLLKQLEHIIESGKRSAELIDISGKKGISKGLFSDVTANAFERARTFDFPPNRRIHPQNQGIFDPDNQGHQLIISSYELASSERGTRDVLFAFACVKAGLDLTNPDNFYKIMEESFAKTKLHRGFARMSALWNRQSKKNAIQNNLETMDKLNLSQATWYLYYLLRDKVRATNESYRHALLKVLSDAGKSIQDSAVGAVEEFADVTIRFAQNVKRDFTYKHIEPSRFDAHIPQQKHDQTIKEEKILASEDTLIEQHVPEFNQWNPNTLYSVVDNFLIDFGGFFIKKYESSPFIWTMATLIGALAGTTAISGPAVKSLLLQCKCPETLANGFVEVSQAISVATTNSQVFQVIGTASTVQQGLFVILDTLAAGADSFTIQAVAECKRNLPIILCVIAGSTFGGWALGQAEIFRAEFGSVPLIAEFFTGLKFAGFGYEAVMHEPEEKSALANTVASSLNGTYNLTRAVLSLLQLGIVAPIKLVNCSRDEAKVAVKNALRPWLDLTDTGTRLFWSSLDITLRCTTTLSRGGKAIVKAALETPINLVAKSAKIAGLGSVSQAIVKGKSATALAFDDCIARPLHNVTRTVRRDYAILMTQDDMYLGASPLSLAHSPHSFCQVIKKNNLATQAESHDHEAGSISPPPQKKFNGYSVD